MNTPGEYRAERASVAASITRHSVRLILGTLGAAAFVLLRLAEPVVRIALTALGLLSILIALFYRLASSPPHSPFWLLVGFGFLCGFVLLAYEHFLHFLSRSYGRQP